MAVTFDTNVLLSSTLWHDSVAQKFLFQLIRKEVKIYSSLKIIAEYQKVLKRDFGFSEEEINDIMEQVISFVTLISPQLQLEVVKDDPDDNIIVECAVASGSAYIITYDQHLLKMKQYQKIQILKPEEARVIF